MVCRQRLLPRVGHAVIARPQLGLRVVLVLALAVVGLVVPTVAASAADPCSAPVNVIACENSKPGTPQSVWDIEGAGDDSLQGFATAMSVNPGDTEKFKVKTTASSYAIDIYRLGWYGGDGARKIASVTPVPQVQPACVNDATTGDYDCGTWKVSASWAVPADAVSGVYIAKLTNPVNGDDSHITFVVRNDASHSDIVFQTSDTTWEAYNQYGGSDFYTGEPVGRAYKISYNRPFATRGSTSGRDFLFSNEFPMLQFLERNGYDVSYMSGLDTARRGALIKNHNVFMSVGHDEYWSGEARASVEAARDAGVNLAFFSGNEVYWKTRWEPSIDGSSTADRTFVSYKETWSDAKIDPSSEWTGTWRDPRFSPPSNGNRPENALTGTMFMSNSDDLAIQVSDVEGKNRLWRNTTLSSQAAGQKATLAAHTIGYESDEDIDNGFRPAGLIRLSTTTGATPEYLRDYGSTVTPGTTTHHLTEYKAPSGALVFGAGTIQWAWGLSANHDGAGAPADSRIQQATINILADMHAQPTTVMTGVVAAAASTDTTGPTATITSPAAAATIANGTNVTATGTASDVGGRVAGVEVSTDGTTWHPATGLTAWTYSYTQHGSGSVSIRVRATDDSANIGTIATNAVTSTCPCSLFGNQVPVTAAANDTSSVELGVTFKASANGFINGIRFYKGAGNTGTHTGTVWSTSGTALSTGTFTSESASGWQTLQLSSPVAVTAGTSYVASYFAPNGHYSADANFFTAADYTAAPLSAAGHQSGVLNGVYNDGHGFPSQSFGNTNYWVDVLYATASSSAPVVSTQKPLSGASSVAATIKPAATFSMDVTPATVTLTLKDSAGTAVAGSMAYDSATRTATFTPTATLAPGTTYTASARATSSFGIPMPAPSTWSFTTAQPAPTPGVCPCSIWNDSTTPATITTNDSGSVELGVKFTADVSGKVTGVRFYKGPQNTGTHTGSLWSSAGALLATATFAGESSTGWQTVTFSTPVTVTSGTTYVASYRAPQGFYSNDPDGLRSAVDASPLHTLAGGGVYTYGAGAPTTSSGGTNYWVDVVFTADDAAPVVSSTSPAGGATNVNIGVTPSAAFAAQIQTGTAVLALKDSVSGTSVTGSAAYVSGTRTITFTPSSALAPGISYTATVSGAKAVSGAQMSPFSWNFTTAGASACPCTLFDTAATPATADSGDTSSVELGVRFIPQVDGRITGLRFYKSAANTGTHVGNLWTSAGSKLASVTFTGESASGWQTASFATPVRLSGGVTYVLSYLAPKGHYSASGGFFNAAWTNGPLTAPAGTNGVYRYGATSGFPNNTYGATNYWVDPVFVPPTGQEPDVADQTPIPDASSVAASVTPTATFAAAVDPTTVVFGLKDAAGTAVTGATTYDATAKKATFTPSSALTRGVKYTASIKASNTTGLPMSAPITWSFTTAQPTPAPGVCPCSIWDDATTPGLVTAADTDSVELGVKFAADVAGQVTGVRFYKGPSNTGTHTGTLWSSAGAVLATATFTGESSTGWQTVTFSTPVTVAAGTTYVVSYRAPDGHYSADSNGLSNVVDAPPLHTIAGGAVYNYGTGFPTNASSANYWVDVVFTKGP